MPAAKKKLNATMFLVPSIFCNSKLIIDFDFLLVVIVSLFYCVQDSPGGTHSNHIQ